MTVSVKLILTLLLAALALGVWSINLLLGERMRQRYLKQETTGDTASDLLWLRRLDRRLASKGPFLGLSRRLRSAGLAWSPVSVTMAMVGIMLATLVLGRFILGYIASTIVMLMLPAAGLKWLQYRGLRRREDFTAQLPQLARIIANGNSAGLSMGRCLEMAGRELPEPAGSEMARVAAHLDLGWSLESALHELSERLPSRELNVLIRTIVIQARAGGALTDALTEISQTLEDRKELRREVRTVVLGASMSGYAVMGISGGAIVIANFIKPGVLDHLAGSGLGRIVLIVSFSFFAVGAVLMRLVSRIEV